MGIATATATKPKKKREVRAETKIEALKRAIKSYSNEVEQAFKSNGGAAFVLFVVTVDGQSFSFTDPIEATTAFAIVEQESKQRQQARRAGPSQ